MQDEQSIVFPNGTTLKLREDQTTFVSEGTMPEGSTWSLIPMPPTLLGPCCIPGTNDTASTPNACLAGETAVAGCADQKSPLYENNCAPCPETAGLSFRREACRRERGSFSPAESSGLKNHPKPGMVSA